MPEFHFGLLEAVVVVRFPAAPIAEPDESFIEDLGLTVAAGTTKSYRPMLLDFSADFCLVPSLFSTSGLFVLEVTEL